MANVRLECQLRFREYSTLQVLNADQITGIQMSLNFSPLAAIAVTLREPVMEPASICKLCPANLLLVPFTKLFPNAALCGALRCCTLPTDLLGKLTMEPANIEFADMFKINTGNQGKIADYESSIHSRILYSFSDSNSYTFTPILPTLRADMTPVSI